MLISHAANPAGPMPEDLLKNLKDPFAEVGGYLPRSNDPRSYFMTVANKRSDYERNLEVEQSQMYNGIPFIGNLQDRAMTELMCSADGEPLYDRTQENLGSSDAMIIAVRAQLLTAARAFRDSGQLPPNLEDPDLDRVRAATVILPDDADWRNFSEAARNADGGVPVAAAIPLIMD